MTCPRRLSAEAARATLSEATVRREPPTGTCAASARRRCRFCCGWRPRGAWRACSRCWRSISSGVALAIFTALVIKAAVLGHVDASQAFDETQADPRLRLPADRAAVRALGAVRRARAAPGPVADRGLRSSRSRSSRCCSRWSAANTSRASTSSGARSAFALLYVSSLRGAYERLTGALLRAAGYQRRAVLVGTGKHIRDVAHALARRAALADRGRRLPLAERAARQRPALAGLAARPRGGARQPNGSTR